MSFDSQENQSAQLRQLQLELNDAQNQIVSLQSAQEQTAADITLLKTATSKPGTRPTISNLIRNGDFNHSVNTWFEPTPSADNKELECANIYAHAGIVERRVNDGQIVIATNTLFCLTSAPFLMSDVGERIVVIGADTAGGDLVTTIAAYLAPDAVNLTDAAASTVANVTVRFRMKKLTHTNSKTNPGDTVNDNLKDPAHTDFSSNIQDPQWDKEIGVGQVGSTNFLSFPLGYYEYIQGDPPGNGTNFISLNTIFPNRPIFARINVARATQYIKPKGQLFLGLFNNHDSQLTFIHGEPFMVSGEVVDSRDVHMPALASTIDYLIIAETDQGYSIRSAVLTLTSAPDESQFSGEVFVKLSWPSFAGAINYKIYRQIDGGAVYLLESDAFATTSYVDTNPGTRINTGSIFFPNPANANDGVSAYIAVDEKDLANLVVNGEGNWKPIEGIIPIPASVDLKKLEDPCLLIGFTEAASIEVVDAVSTNGDTTITSAAGQFVAGMVGETYIITDPAVPTNTQTGVISSFTDANTVELDTPVTWDAADNIFEIVGYGAHGIYMDLAGASLTVGDFDYHIEDRTGRPQNVASNPEGSTQGGIGGSNSSGPSGGGDVSGGSSDDSGGTVISCIIAQDREAYIKIVGEFNQILDIPVEMLGWDDKVFFGQYDENDAPLFNTIDNTVTHEVDELYHFETGRRPLPVTGTHRFPLDQADFRQGTQAIDIEAGNYLLLVEEEGYRMTPVLNRHIRRGKFKVISIFLKDDGSRTTHLMIINDILCHNLKDQRSLDDQSSF